MEGTGAHDRGSAGVATADRIVLLDLIGTAVFGVTAVAAAVVFTNPLRILGVVVALTLFAIGVVAFLWSYWTAVQRSRTDDIAVAQLYFLTGTSAPSAVKRQMNLALLGQTITGLATAIARSTTDGRAGSTLAFGILVPMFGLGLNGLWCSKFGTFGPRQVRSSHTATTDPAIEDAADPAASASVPDSDDQMEQNSRHG